jgi:hypothetical protein
MAHKLPNELIKEILEPVLDVPDDLFHDVSDRPPFGRLDHVSAITLLTICKNCMGVAIMLLYRVVILRSKPQAYALERILQAKPHLGSYVRKLRIEGGFGEVMHKIVILLSPNVNDLFLSLDISRCDSTKGLCSSLATLNPSCVTLWEPALSDNQQTAAGRNLNASVATCMANWKKMVNFF